MKKLSNFLCWTMAAAMTLGIIVSLIVCAWVVSVLCGFSFFSVFALVSIAFFTGVWILLNSMFKDLDISFNDDDEDLM